MHGAPSSVGARGRCRAATFCAPQADGSIPAAPSTAVVVHRLSWRRNSVDGRTSSAANYSSTHHPKGWARESERRSTPSGGPRRVHGKDRHDGARSLPSERERRRTGKKCCARACVWRGCGMESGGYGRDELKAVVRINRSVGPSWCWD